VLGDRVALLLNEVHGDPPQARLGVTLLPEGKTVNNEESSSGESGAIL
jgi:hypothetical protein